MFNGDIETLDLRISFSRSKDFGTIDDAGLEREEDEPCNERGCDISCLSSLVQLRKLIFDGDLQILGMEEALWMIERRKDLVRVRGAFKGVVEGDDLDKLKQLFAGKVVHYSEHQNMGAYLNAQTYCGATDCGATDCAAELLLAILFTPKVKKGIKRASGF